MTERKPELESFGMEEFEPEIERIETEIIEYFFPYNFPYNNTKARNKVSRDNGRRSKKRNKQPID